MSGLGSFLFGSPSKSESIPYRGPGFIYQGLTADQILRGQAEAAGNQMAAGGLLSAPYAQAAANQMGYFSPQSTFGGFNVYGNDAFGGGYGGGNPFSGGQGGFASPNTLFASNQPSLGSMMQAGAANQANAPLTGGHFDQLGQKINNKMYGAAYDQSGNLDYQKLAEQIQGGAAGAGLAALPSMQYGLPQQLQQGAGSAMPGNMFGSSPALSSQFMPAQGFNFTTPSYLQSPFQSNVQGQLSSMGYQGFDPNQAVGNAYGAMRDALTSDINQQIGQSRQRTLEDLNTRGLAQTGVTTKALGDIEEAGQRTLASSLGQLAADQAKQQLGASQFGAQNQLSALGLGADVQNQAFQNQLSQGQMEMERQRNQAQDLYQRQGYSSDVAKFLADQDFQRRNAAFNQSLQGQTLGYNQLLGLSGLAQSPMENLLKLYGLNTGGGYSSSTGATGGLIPMAASAAAEYYGAKG